jgi:hypothetical protein
MKITSINTYLEINRILKIEKGIRAQSGPAWPSDVSRLAQGRGPAWPAGRTTKPSQQRNAPFAKETLIFNEIKTKPSNYLALFITLYSLHLTPSPSSYSLS